MGFRDALDAVREEALALDPAALRPVKGDIPSATITVRGALPTLQRLRPAVVAAFRELDLGAYDRLGLYTRALTQANGEYLATARRAAEVPPLLAELKKIRTTLLTDMQAAVRRALIDKSHLDNLRGANGAKNPATDVITLCALVRKQWPALTGRTGIDLGEIDRAEQLAEALQAALARAEHSDSAKVAAADLRQRVYTLFFNAYDEARRAIAFLRWREGDAHEIAPSLMALRSKASRAKPQGEPAQQIPSPAVSELLLDPEFGPISE